MDLVGAGRPEPPLVLAAGSVGGSSRPGWVPGEPSWQVTDLLPDPVQDPGVVAGREFGAEWPPPALLDGTDPGPLLASLAAEADLGSCSDDLVVGVASAASRLQAWAAALEAAATAELVARAGRWRGVTPSGQPVGKHTVAAERIAAAELSCALGVSERSAQNRVALALDLQRLPETSAALAAGRLHHYTARLVVDTLRPLGGPGGGPGGGGGAAPLRRALRSPTCRGRCAARCWRSTRRRRRSGAAGASRTAPWRPTPCPTGWPRPR